MMKCEWILCPVCGSKTRNKIRKDTVLENYPLYCPKCRQERLINDVKPSSIKQRCQPWVPYESVAARFMYRLLDYGYTKYPSIDDAEIAVRARSTSKADGGVV